VWKKIGEYGENFVNKRNDAQTRPEQTKQKIKKIKDVKFFLFFQLAFA